MLVHACTQDESGSTSLHLAADGDHCAVLELLLKNGAHLEIKGWCVTDLGHRKTALMDFDACD